MDKPLESAKTLYDRLEQSRQPYVTRAEENAKYTIPSIFPKDSDNNFTNYITPYQSVGSRGVNNLASKLMLALLPPNAPFFRLTAVDEAKQGLNDDILAKTEEALGKIERKIMRYIETNQIRVTVSEAIKSLIITGNALLYLPPQEGGLKCYKLNSYVIQRDALGNIINIITIDKIAYAALPLEVKSIVADGQEIKPDKEFEVFTHAYLEDDVFYSYQEVNKTVIQGTEQMFPRNKIPWIPIRMVKIDGENYGRSFVEEYIGDLRSLEVLSKAIVEAAAIAANVIYLVNPNGITQVRKIANASTGEFVPGRKDDIQALTLDKYADLQVAKATADGIESRLSYAFLLNSAVQRNGERVTAEEIRYVAGELEDTLGGIYSILSQEFQLPLVRRLLIQLQKTGELPDLPEGLVEPAITTGLEALGRGHDLNKLRVLMEYIAQIPDATSRINMDNLLTRIATALSIDTAGLVKTDLELQEEMQMQQQIALMQQAVPHVAKGVMEQQQQQQ